MGLVMVVMASCEKQEQKPEATKKSIITTNLKPDASTPERKTPVYVEEEKSTYNGSKLAEEQGLQALPFIYENTSGDERFNTMLSAMSVLEKQYNQAQLLEAILKLNPGRSRDDAITKALDAKPAPLKELLAQFQKIEPDLRTPCWLSIQMNTKIGSREDFDLLSKAVESDSALDKLFRKSLQEHFMGKYAGSLAQKDSESIITELNALPVETQTEVAESVSSALSHDESGAGYDKALKLAGAMSEQKVVAEKMYEMCFRRMGEEKPSALGERLDQVPAEYRPAAVKSYVSAWVKDDPMAASAWVRKQNANDQQAAAVSIVRYLEYKKAPVEEIAPWRNIRDAKK